MASIPLCSDNVLTTHAHHMQLTMQYGIHA